MRAASTALRSIAPPESVQIRDAAEHAGDCHSTCGGVFYCCGCDALVAWCLGAADAYGRLCDSCAVDLLPVPEVSQ